MNRPAQTRGHGPLGLETLEAFMSRPGLDRETRYLASILALTVLDRPKDLETVLGRALRDSVPLAAVREILLQSMLFAGFPRCINGFGCLETVLRHPDLRALPRERYQTEDPPRDPTRDETHHRGAELFRTIYDGNDDDVRHQLRGYHPDLEEWVLEVAYGRILSRPFLAPRTRELAAVAALVVSRLSRQLLSHIRGALNVGATRDEVREVIEHIGLHVERKTVEWGLRYLAARG